MSTKYTGKSGQVQTPTSSEITGINSWTLDVSSDVVETTSFDDSGVRAYLGTIQGWSGSFEGFKTGVPITLSGASATCTLRETGSANQDWVGTVYITGHHTTSSHDGLVTYTYDFQGSGGVTEPTA